tara:strand:+ start:960 stop:2339 length:1380 start_codon:yes stop_codon:yes gene_type:complete
MSGVPTSGEITMFKIGNEKNQSDYNSDDTEISDDGGISLRGLSVNNVSDTVNGTVGDIPLNADSPAGVPDQNPPHKMSEFRGYNHDFVATDWIATNSLVAASSSYFNVTSQRNAGGSVQLRQNVQLNFKGIPQGGADASTIQLSESIVPSVGPSFTGGTGQSSELAGTSGLGISNTGTNDRYENITKIEARWRFKDVDVTFNADNNGPTETVKGHIVPGGSLSSGVHEFRNLGEGNQLNLNESQSYVDITPSVGALSGGGAMTQTHFIELFADVSSADTADTINLDTNSSNPSTEFIALDIRLNSDDTKVLTIRSTGVDMSATSFRAPEFSCIMPDMIVEHQTKGPIRIGDIVVGDHILTSGNLNDATVEPIWTEVTKAETHTRSGYWNVKGGLHITNDHPVWLTDEWVKVEDMRADIDRTYVEGTVDPVYLETTNGHYYVYTTDYEYLVSGNYAPTTE